MRGRRICDRLPLVATTGLHKGSIFCCLYWIRGLAGAIGQALELDEGDRRGRIERWRQQWGAAISRARYLLWTEQELAAAEEAPRRRDGDRRHPAS
jgi:hypothetical protein